MRVPPKVLCGVVVSAGKMMKAVKVRTTKQVYNSFLKKHFQTYESHLVSDPTNSLRTGDVVRIASGWRASKHINHRVTEIVAPWGPPISERPKIPSDEEILAMKGVKKAAKMERRAQKRDRGEISEEAGGSKSSPGGVEALMEVAS
ncbi:MAG: hypothetical protein Q9195_002866 [Heterodermia aff. obscurata]